MKKWIVLAGILLASVAHADVLRLVTEEYPPFSYRSAGAYKGSSIDQVDLLMKDAGLQYSVEMMPWARAIALAETQALTCVFTAVHTEDRDKRFKWVEPLMVDRTILVRKAGSAVKPQTLEDASKFVVGTTRGDFAIGILEARKFAKIDLTTDFNLTLKKLLNDRIDLMPMSEKYFDKLRREGVGIEDVLVLVEQINSMACNISVPDEDISKMQASLTKLIDNGTQGAVLRRYGLEPAE